MVPALGLTVQATCLTPDWFNSRCMCVWVCSPRGCLLANLLHVSQMPLSIVHCAQLTGQCKIMASGASSATWRATEGQLPGGGTGGGEISCDGGRLGKRPGPLDQQLSLSCVCLPAPREAASPAAVSCRAERHLLPTSLRCSSLLPPPAVACSRSTRPIAPCCLPPGTQEPRRRRNAAVASFPTGGQRPLQRAARRDGRRELRQARAARPRQ
jgi:hypothetical protein